MRIVSLSLILVFLVLGCALRVKVSEIKSEPEKYDSRQVSIKGTVVETVGIPFVQKGIYQVDDGTGKIWVVSQERRPSRGEKVAVKGEVKTGLSIGDRSFGIAIVEGDDK